MQKHRVRITAFDWVPDFASGQVRDLRLRWALNEAGYDYDIDLVRFGTQDGPENRRRQPFGQVPVMAVDDVSMFESGACLWRIAQSSAALLPEDESQRDACLSWVFAALNTIEPPITMLAHLKFMEWRPDGYGLPDAGAPVAVQPSVRTWVSKRLKQLAEALDGRDHMVGDRFTIADLILTAVLLPLARLEILAETPAISAYFTRHTARPAFQAAQQAQIKTHRDHAGIYG